jgi:hypothetical protein
MKTDCCEGGGNTSCTRDAGEGVEKIVQIEGDREIGPSAQTPKTSGTTTSVIASGTFGERWGLVSPARQNFSACAHVALHDAEWHHTQSCLYLHV